MAYDFSAVVSQMRSAGIAQGDIDAFLQEQQRLEQEFTSQFTTQKNAADTAFTTAQNDIAAMFAKEQQMINEQQAAFEMAQKQAQEQAAALEASAIKQQEETAKQQEEAAAAFAATTLRNKRATEEVQRESAERIAGRRRSRRSAGARQDSLINAAVGANAKVPTLGTQASIAGNVGSLGTAQKLGVGG